MTEEDWVVEAFTGSRYEVCTHDPTEQEAQKSMDDYVRNNPKVSYRVRKVK